MKQRLLTFICLLAVCFCSTMACAADRLLPNLKKQPGLSSVYVGKELLNMAGASSDMGIPGVNMSSMGKNLDSIEVLTAETPSTVQYLRPLTTRAIEQIDNIELAMENDEDDCSTQIYVVPSADGKNYTRLIILVNDDSEFIVIDMQGTLPLDALTQLSL